MTSKIGTAKINFMVDTGASLSILPLSIINGIMIDPTAVSLCTANGNKIKCFSQADLEIGIQSLSQLFPWTFLIADITNPLIRFTF